MYGPTNEKLAEIATFASTRDVKSQHFYYGKVSSEL